MRSFFHVPGSRAISSPAGPSSRARALRGLGLALILGLVAPVAVAQQAAPPEAPAQPDMRPSLPGDRVMPPPPDAPAVDPSLPPGVDPQAGGLATRGEETLETLFARLRTTTKEDEAKTVAKVIEARLLASGSDTIDLLMARVLAAMGNNQPAVALDLLDTIIMLRPAYAEAWHRRASIQFTRQNVVGALTDLERALALEPRNFNAMRGLAVILEQSGDKKQALAVYRRFLDLWPSHEEVKKEADQLAIEVEGRGT